MAPTTDQGLFRADIWNRALTRYSAATHLTVEVTGRDGARVLGPLASTPLFELLARHGGDRTLFAACARRCLEQAGEIAGLIVEERHGLAVVGTRLTLGGTTVGAAVAGYVMTAFPDQRSTQRLAQESNAAYGDLWPILRRQLPLARERVLVYGELLQTVCDTLTNEHHRSRELEAASARLVAESEAKDRFLAVLSHELRTPLTAMLGWLRMLRMGKLGETARTRALEVIERNTVLQAQLIEDLLHISRIVAGKVELDRRPVRLGPVVLEAIEAIRPAADAKGLELDVVLESSSALVSADVSRMEQVVSNILSNAIKFTPAGGRIGVRLAKRQGEVEISIADTGAGITAEFLPHVFDRFRQADDATTRPYAGLGLGLTIVRHLVDGHGGRVEAASRGKDQGSTITVWLPALPDDSVERSETTRRITDEDDSVDDVPNLEGVRVLLVDDEADARELFTSILKQHKIEVAAVSSVEEALRVLRRWRPDVVVSDIGMATQSGYDLVRAMRGLPADEGAAIPALAVTAYAGSDNSRRVLAAGFQGHLAKPVEPLVLAHAVARLAGRMKAA